LCIICLENVEIASEMFKSRNCRHTFHVECMRNWVQTRDNCPTCREEIFELCAGDENWISLNQFRLNANGIAQTDFSQHQIPQVDLSPRRCSIRSCCFCFCDCFYVWWSTLEATLVLVRLRIPTFAVWFIILQVFQCFSLISNVFQRIREEKPCCSWGFLLLTTIIAYHSSLGYLLMPELLIHATLWPWVVFFHWFEVSVDINDAAIQLDPNRSSGICAKFVIIIILIATWISMMSLSFSRMELFHATVWPVLGLLSYISFMKFLCRNGIIN